MRGRSWASPSKEYKSYIELEKIWDFRHQAPGTDQPSNTFTNVMPDQAAVMKINPQLKVALYSGYFDLVTLFFAADYQIDHLGLPPYLRKNIEIRKYKTGHMIYLNPEGLKDLRRHISKFIQASSGT